MEHESDGNWYVWYSHQRIGIMTGGLENKRTNGNYQNLNIVKIGQNTEKSPGDLRRLTAIQSSVRNHQLTLV